VSLWVAAAGLRRFAAQGHRVSTHQLGITAWCANSPFTGREVAGQKRWHHADNHQGAARFDSSGSRRQPRRRSQRSRGGRKPGRTVTDHGRQAAHDHPARNRDRVPSLNARLAGLGPGVSQQVAAGTKARPPTARATPGPAGSSPPAISPAQPTRTASVALDDQRADRLILIPLLARYLSNI
jgi:hypothetical protein